MFNSAPPLAVSQDDKKCLLRLIPTGFCPKAQGCAARATLGHRPKNIINRNAVAAIPVRPSRAIFAATALRLFPFPNLNPR